jgi:hypothetical protein
MIPAVTDRYSPATAQMKARKTVLLSMVGKGLRRVMWEEGKGCWRRRGPLHELQQWAAIY